MATVKGSWLCSVSGSVYTDEQYASDIATLFGTKLAGMHLGKDVVCSGANVTSWPGRYTAPTLVSATSYHFTTGTYYGRTCVVDSGDGQQKYMVASPGPTNYRAVMAVTCPPASKSGIKELFRIRAAGPVLVTADGTSMSWYAPSHWRNGVATEIITPSKFAVYEGRETSSDTLIFGSYPGVNRVWTGPVAALIYLNANPTAEEQSSCVALTGRWIPEVLTV